MWLHPKLDMIWNVTITLAVGGFCCCSYVAFKGFVSQFDGATRLREK